MTTTSKYRPSVPSAAKASTLSAQQLAWLEEQATFGIHEAVGERLAHYWRTQEPTPKTDTDHTQPVMAFSADAPKAGLRAVDPNAAKSSAKPPSAKQRLPNVSEQTPPVHKAAIQPTMSLSSHYQRAKEMAAQAQSLEQLRQFVSTYDGCPLKSTASQMVFGTGTENPLIMIIGEGPGSEEDRLGIPFVGPSGRLIQRCLSVIGVNCRDNLYITNSVYWRPPGDRTPTDTEVAACQPFVARQIALLKPKILLLVGARAAQSFLGVTSGITRLRGGWYPLADGLLDEEIPALAMFHPAYLFRQHSQKRLFWQDIMALRQRIDSMELPIPWPEKPLASFHPEWHPNHPGSETPPHQASQTK